MQLRWSCHHGCSNQAPSCATSQAQREGNSELWPSAVMLMPLYSVDALFLNAARTVGKQTAQCIRNPQMLQHTLAQISSCFEATGVPPGQKAGGGKGTSHHWCARVCPSLLAIFASSAPDVLEVITAASNLQRKLYSVPQRHAQAFAAEMQ